MCILESYSSNRVSIPHLRNLKKWPAVCNGAAILYTGQAPFLEGVVMLTILDALSCYPDINPTKLTGTC